jgi:ADP-ribose pyrophosphatase YjhB (NUDIX family)
MRLDFPWSNDGVVHQYCFGCRAEAVRRCRFEDRTYYLCGACGERHARSIVIDPGLRWWVGEDGEYWHESSGVFLADSSGRFLFFRRTIFPFVLTVPAGHVDAGEDARVAALRELAEEAKVVTESLDPIGMEDVVGDSCRRGADAHRWHAFASRLMDDRPVHIGDEGVDPVWLFPADALATDLAVPVRTIMEKYSDRLLA